MRRKRYARGDTARRSGGLRSAVPHCSTTLPTRETRAACRTPSRDAPRPTAGASKKDLLELAKQFDVRFLRLQFTDILGINKNVEVPRSQFDKALDGEIMFDGSSIEGFVRIEESDMLLKPDLVDLPDPAVRRRGRPGRPAALRHLHARRAAFRRAIRAARSSASSRARSSWASR